MSERYSEILQLVAEYLSKIKRCSKDYEALEKEYFRFIEQDVEKLFNINNDGVYDIAIFEKIKEIYRDIIVITTEEIYQPTIMANMKCIMVDMYYNFKYVYENILFMIEMEFLNN